MTWQERIFARLEEVGFTRCEEGDRITAYNGDVISTYIDPFTRKMPISLLFVVKTYSHKYKESAYIETHISTRQIEVNGISIEDILGIARNGLERLEKKRGENEATDRDTACS